MDSSNSVSTDVPDPTIELTGVHMLFGPTLALDVETLRIGHGERVFVLGRSGSGKSTLARLIKGRLRPTTGSVRVLGRDPAAPGGEERGMMRRRIAMIDQEFFLVPRMTVFGNVLTGCLGRVSTWKTLFGWYPSAELIKANDILGEVELDGLGDRRVDTLSGGQRQRVAIARALMQDAEITLADEPVSNLDPELSEDAIQLLLDCVERRAETLVVCLHQPNLARKFATRIIGLSAGRIVYDGSPRAFTERQAEFLYRSEEGEAGKVIEIGMKDEG